MHADESILAVLACQFLALVAGGASTATIVRGLRERVKGLEDKYEKLPDDYVPRREYALALALIHAGGGDISVALKAVEATAESIALRAAGDPEDDAWLDDYLSRRLPVFEGDVPHFYLDSKGNVTIGCGLLVPDAAAAVRLPMRNSNGQLAGPATIIADFHRVSQMTPNRLPGFYRCPTSLQLSAADRMNQSRARCLVFLVHLRAAFAGFDSFPGAAKAALLDMAWNMGVGRLKQADHEGTGLLGFTHLCRAAAGRNWQACATYCTRERDNHAFDVRNAWTRTQFELAQQEAKA